MDDRSFRLGDHGRSVYKHMRNLLSLLASIIFAASIAAQDAEVDTELAFVFTKTNGTLDRAWALPADTGIADTVPGFWTDLKGQRTYVLPMNCGFYAETLTLRQLSERKGLVALDLSTQSIGDADLKDLARCKTLGQLVLDHTRISDDGLRELRLLSSLRKLSIYQTRVSQVGITELVLANAKLEINIARRGTISGRSPTAETEPSDAPKYRWPVFTNGYSTPGTR